MKQFLLSVLLSCFSVVFAQKTIVYGTVRDGETKETIPGVLVHFQGTKIGVYTDSIGNYRIETFYATDSIVFQNGGYTRKILAVQKDQSQELSVIIFEQISDIGEIVIQAPEESPSTVLHKRMVKNKPINNREKLDAYGYELYNKIQIDVNNLNEQFGNNFLVKRLDLVMNYLDSTQDGTFLPVVFTENISKFDYNRNPKKKREIVSASRMAGIDNPQFSQFMGQMYLDVNAYDNYINLFQQAFISPAADFARTFYKFRLMDSAFIDNQWCYKLTFVPKKTGDLTFEGEMWIHDTTYAIKSFKASISPWANINYVKDLYIEQNFNMVQPEVWMLTSDKMILDLKLTKQGKVYGFYGRKSSSYRDFRINTPYSADYYRTNETVEFEDGAKERSPEYWDEHRHGELNKTEKGVEQMIDSLDKDPFFSGMKTLVYVASTGYYPMGKIEIGNVQQLASFNQIEGFRTGLALRTSNDFSHTIEMGGRVFYGFDDKRFKGGGMVRINLAKKKYFQMRIYGTKDIEQIGLSPNASAVNGTVATLLRVGPLDKVTMLTKMGFSLERDIKKDLVAFTSFEWKEYEALGIARFDHLNNLGNLENINKLQTAEATFRLRYSKNEEYVMGVFDRTWLQNPTPIFSIQGIFGVKGIGGSDYNYQRIEGSIEQFRNIGVFGRFRYVINAGFVSGTVAYPFLKVHEGSQSYWLFTNSFNRMSPFEFISDKYVSVLIENHWQGLFFDRLPLIKKLKWRLVSTARATYGTVDEKHKTEMLFPDFTRSFGNIPYVEVSLGIENIFKIVRVDAVWRLTHLTPEIAPVGIRARWAIAF